MFNFGSRKITLVTHSNRFHADDVLAAAVLLIYFKDKETKIVRTRDQKIIDSGDVVFDVGFVYDETGNRFDHHQKQGAGKRENGIPYSSFGLVWKKFGKDICGSQEIADYLDKKIVQPIDAIDSGIEIHKQIIDGVRPYIFTDIVDCFNPMWPEKEDFDSAFCRLAEFSKDLLTREIQKIKNKKEAEKILREIYENSEDKRIIYINDNYPWEDIFNKYPEPLFVIKSRNDGMCSVNTVRSNVFSFESRKLFPESWAGKNGKELAEITGVEDAIFCHNARFICSAKSKEGAMKLAQMALEE